MLCQSGIQLLSVGWIMKPEQMAKDFDSRQEEPTQQSDPDQLFRTLDFCHERWKHIMVFPWSLQWRLLHGDFTKVSGSLNP